MCLFLICSSKKSISSNQIQCMLGVTYKTAWYTCHRIRYDMDQGPLAEMLKDKVEVDETYVGGKHRKNIGKCLTRGKGTKRFPCKS